MDISDIRKKILIAFISDEELSDILVLKGGNALELIYNLTKRPSVDIDFSMESDFPGGHLERIRERIIISLNREFNDVGLEVFDLKFEEKPPPEKRTNPKGGGYKISFKIIELDKSSGLDLDDKRKRAVSLTGSRKNFSVDISRYEYCESSIKKSVDGHIVYVYSPEMIVIEKMRALCQQSEEYTIQEKTGRRPRPKDIYDIYTICTQRNIKLHEKDNLVILYEMFGRKNVPTDLLLNFEKYRDYHRQGFSELVDTLPQKERDVSYDYIFDYVKKRMIEAGELLSF